MAVVPTPPHPPGSPGSPPSPGSLAPLPIDGFLPEIVARAAAGRPLVLVAEPGAGKTTRVPRALLDAGWGARGEIVVLEPRRLAARMAARRVAEELGEEVGGRVGYQVRFEERGGPQTRVRFVTEGVLVRRLADRPDLPGVAVVVLDEFHERSLDADLALALVRRARDTARPDLRVIVMSATLDAEPVAAFLGGDVLRVPGRAHPVEVAFLPRPDPRPLEALVAAGVRCALDETPGDVLVFLPGAAEIRRASEALAGLAPEGLPRGLAVLPLHGDLPPAEQDRAVRPAGARKVVLATNVAETSITIDGVTAVVDSGLHRLAAHSPWSGLPTLTTAPISRASAAQRAGRAGRTGPGRCLRLYTRHDHDTRPAFDAPEVRRADLAGLLLVAAAGADGASGLPWFEPPPEPALAAARELLDRLGAIDAGGRATALGRAMLRFPLHPRAARLLLAAAERGATREGALVAALLGERDVRRAARLSLGVQALPASRGAPGGRSGSSGSSDLLEQAEAIERGDRDLEPATVRQVLRARDQLVRIAGRGGRAAPARAGADHVVRAGADDIEAALLRATLLAFPDRVARRRARGAADVVFSAGGAGTLGAESVVHEAALLVAVDAQEQRGRVIVRSASAIEAEWLLDEFPARLRDEAAAAFDPATERVEYVSRLAYDAVVLEETRRSDATGPEVTRALFEAARAAGPRAFCEGDELDRWNGRLEFARRSGADLAPWDDAAQAAALASMCEGRRSFTELRDADLVAVLRAGLGPRERELDEIAPASIRLPGGRALRVHYAPGKAPWVESYLQDFAGMTETPRVGRAREPVVVHLLAPSRRPVQVTSDLAGFWSRTYPQLRTQLMRRYPKHRWP